MAAPKTSKLPSVSISSQKLVNDTGASSTDGITSDGAVVLTGTVSGATGTIVQIYDGTILLGTSTLDGRGGWSFSTTLLQGTHSLRAVARDTAGQKASSASQPTLIVDKTPPAVAISSQVLARDTGLSGTDGVTSDGAVTLKGTVGVETGTKVQIYDGSSLLGTATLDGKGGWTFSTTLLEGQHALRAVATDLAGLTTTTATQATIIVDKTPPALSISSQVLAHDTGLSGSDGITTDGTVTLTGTVTAGAGTTVQVYDGNTSLGSAALDGNGGWTFGAVLSDGTHALHAVATDLAGNSSITVDQSQITVDHSAAAVLYRFEYQIVGSNTVQLFGEYSGPAGTQIDVYSGATKLGTATITGANTWTFETPALPDGNYSFTAVATTPAGLSTTFGDIPSITVGWGTGTLDMSGFSTVWHQDFTENQIDRDVFQIVYGQDHQFAYGSDGLTLTSYRADGFTDVGILQPTWGADLAQGYGLYSITASHPANQGTGIAILLWPSDNIWPGPEMDLVEDWNDPTSQTAYFSVHTKSPLDGSDMINTIQYSIDLTRPNTFALDWEEGSLTYYVNGDELFQITGSEVPRDFAHGGVNAAFGAQVSNIGDSWQPSDEVSLTIHDMSYAVKLPAPASIKVSNPGSIAQTDAGAVQQVEETITTTGLQTSTVYAMVLSKDNVAYKNWEAVTLDANGVGHYTAEFHATGDYLAVTTDPGNLSVLGWSRPVTLDAASNPGGLLSMAVAHDQLWFERSGDDLVIDVLGTTSRTFIDEWYLDGKPAQQVQAADGMTIDSGIDDLVEAMASFAAAHPGFDTMTTTHASLTESGYFGAALASAIANDWLA